MNPIAPHFKVSVETIVFVTVSPFASLFIEMFPVPKALFKVFLGLCVPHSRNTGLEVGLRGFWGPTFSLTLEALP